MFVNPLTKFEVIITTMEIKYLRRRTGKINYDKNINNLDMWNEIEYETKITKLDNRLNR